MSTELQSVTTQNSQIHHFTLTYNTQKSLDIVDITDDVERVLLESGVTSGLVNIYTRHTTTTIKINEHEDGFFEDFRRFCRQFAPASGDYKHNDLSVRDPKTLCDGEECLNGHSHVLQMFVGTASEHVPVVDGKLQLGRWQRVLFLELDRAKERQVMVTVMGE